MKQLDYNITFCGYFLCKIPQELGEFERLSAYWTASGAESVWRDNYNGQLYKLTIQPLREADPETANYYDGKEEDL